MNKKLIKRIGWILFFMIIIVWSIYDLYTKTIEQGRGYLIKHFAEIVFIIVLSYLFVYKLSRERAIKISQYVGFSCFFLWVLLGVYLPSFLSEYLLIFGVIGVATSLFLKKHVSSKEGGKTLEENIKNKLKINSKNLKLNLPKSIGGFVFPMLPFFHVTSKRWKGSLGKEAIIHENVHLYYLQQGWLVFVVIGILLLYSFVKNMLPKTADIQLVILFIFVLSTVLFEYVTFNKTHKIGKSMGIVTRQWNKKLALKYFIAYLLQFISVFFAYQGIKFIVIVIMGWM